MWRIRKAGRRERCRVWWGSRWKLGCKWWSESGGTLPYRKVRLLKFGTRNETTVQGKYRFEGHLKRAITEIVSKYRIFHRNVKEKTKWPGEGSLLVMPGVNPRHWVGGGTVSLGSRGAVTDVGELWEKQCLSKPKEGKSWRTCCPVPLPRRAMLHVMECRKAEDSVMEVRFPWWR